MVGGDAEGRQVLHAPDQFVDLIAPAPVDEPITELRISPKSR